MKNASLIDACVHWHGLAWVFIFLALMTVSLAGVALLLAGTYPHIALVVGGVWLGLALALAIVTWLYFRNINALR